MHLRRTDLLRDNTPPAWPQLVRYASTSAPATLSQVNRSSTNLLPLSPIARRPFSSLKICTSAAANFSASRSTTSPATAVGTDPETPGFLPQVAREYDKNGNLTLETKTYTDSSNAPQTLSKRRYTYDGWNRLAAVDVWDAAANGGNGAWNPLSIFSYNALNWRVLERTRRGNESTPTDLALTRLYYYSNDWQVLQVDEDSTTVTAASSEPSVFSPTKQSQYFYGLRGGGDKDDIVLRRTRTKSPPPGGGTPVWVSWQGSERRYYLTDSHFSVVATTDSYGQVKERTEYDDYGNPHPSLIGDLNGDGLVEDADYVLFYAAYDVLECTALTPTPMPFGDRGGACPADLNEDGLVDDTDFNLFVASYNKLLPDDESGPRYAGYWYDANISFFNCRQRWYDPQAGRWLTRDPAGYVDGMSLYLYVKGNPWSGRDPTGLYTWGECGQIAGAFASGAAHAYGQAWIGSINMVKQVGLGVYDGGGLAADAVATAFGGGFDFQPQSSVGMAAAADPTNWAAQTYELADNAKTTIASLTIADTIRNTSDYADGKISADEFSQGQGATSANAALMALGGPERGRTGSGEASSGGSVARVTEQPIATPSEGPPSPANLSPYSNLPDPRGVGPGKPFTRMTKRQILEQNKATNGGMVRSDQSGTQAVPPEQSQAGVTPPANEAQIDHIVPKSKGGTNSPSNAQVLTRQENRAKSNK